MTQQPTSRRNVILGMCALAGAGLTGLFEVAPATAASAIKVRADGKVDVTLSVMKKNGAVVRIPSLNAALVRVSATKFIAYSLVCRHQGGPVMAVGASWTCSLHGAKYSPKDGSVQRGPATQPLKRLPVKVAKGIATVG